MLLPVCQGTSAWTRLSVDSGGSSWRTYIHGPPVQAAVALRLALKTVGCDRVPIVAPAALTLNWERELARWAPDRTVRHLQGSRLDREACYQLPIPVVVGSYEQIRLDISQCDASTHFDIAVLDEAQRIKNAESETAFACRRSLV